MNNPYSQDPEQQPPRPPEDINEPLDPPADPEQPPRPRDDIHEPLHSPTEAASLGPASDPAPPVPPPVPPSSGFAEGAAPAPNQPLREVHEPTVEVVSAQPTLRREPTPQEVIAAARPARPAAPGVTREEIRHEGEPRDDRDDRAGKAALLLATLATIMGLVALLLLFDIIPYPFTGAEQLKNGAVTSEKIQDESVTTEDLAAELPEGPEGPAGPRGKTGPKGERGPKGPPGVTDLQVVQKSLGPNSENKTVTILCPGTKEALGGGGEVTGGGPQVVLRTSAPTEDGRGWIAVAQESQPVASSWTLEASAICAKVASSE